jgi:DNA-3-methyladenine glycosylase II
MPAHAIHNRFLTTAAEFSPKLAAAIERAGPQTMRSRRDLPFAEYLARAIVGQQLSVAAARTIWGRVEARANGAAVIDLFCERNLGALRECGMSNAKAKAIVAIAEADRTVGLGAEKLSAMSYADRTEALTAIWGVGRWTADMMSMFYFGETDVWPDGDVGARKTLERLTGRRRSTVKTAARFAPHRSYLALYMWAHADARPG